MIVWTFVSVLTLIFNGPAMVKMLREELREGETPEDAARRNLLGRLSLPATVVSILGGYITILLVFPRILGS